MEFRVLGSIEARDDDRTVPLGGAKPRALLATLLLAQGRIVPVERLIEVIWRDAPPRSAAGLIQTYVSALRRALERPGRPAVIVTRPPGYLLDAAGHEIDCVRFQRLAEQGRLAARNGQHEAAAETFRHALRLWRGPALEGMPAGRLAGEAAGLDEMRLAVLEARVAADLALRRYPELCAELRVLVAAHPTREQLRRHLMVALYATDRQADALAVFRAGRQLLVEELGIEPGPALQTAHEAILRGDRGLLGLPTRRPAATDPAPHAVTGEQVREPVEAGHWYHRRRHHTRSSICTASHTVL
jgi:DNA-binding SARP family transcriptional activator